MSLLALWTPHRPSRPAQLRSWNEPGNQARVQAAYQQINDPTVVYPAYFTVPFHAYAEGNMGWLPPKPHPNLS